MVNNQADKLDWKLTFIIGLGFFTTGITWSLYNSYLPIFLRDIITNNPYWYAILGTWINTFIGIVMILDNIAAITLQPWIGAKSDKTWTRFGRRMPYILTGVPLAALFFIFIPITKELLLLLLVVTCFNIAMALYRAPVVALMPDLIPSKFRSRANGVINFMGGVGAVYAFFVGSYLYEWYGPWIAFLSTSIIMLIALAILFFNIREPERPLDLEERVGIINAFSEVISDSDKSGIYILLAIMMWFFGYYIIETWFTTYGKLILGITEAQASRMLTGFALTFILFAIPAGYIAKYLGRRNTIVTGLVGLTAIMVVLAPMRDVLLITILLTIGGVFWALININSIVIVWEIGGEAKLGAYTGLYYFFSMFAAIVGPVLAGAIFDYMGHWTMFWISAAFMLIAFLLTLMVRSGEGEK